jgi:hypothetical protein
MSVFVPISGPKIRKHLPLATEDVRPAIDEYPEGIISGECLSGLRISLVSYNNLLAYHESHIKINSNVPFEFQ